jgi:hypothetical protein
VISLRADDIIGPFPQFFLHPPLLCSYAARSAAEIAGGVRLLQKDADPGLRGFGTWSIIQ